MKKDEREVVATPAPAILIPIILVGYLEFSRLMALLFVNKNNFSSSFQYWKIFFSFS